MDFGFEGFNSIGLINIDGHCFTREGLDEDLHSSTSEPEDHIHAGSVLDVVIGHGSSVFELLSSEDESLLLCRDTFPIEELGFDAFNCFVFFDVHGDDFSCEGFD